MKSFSELTSASQVNNGDLLAISQTSGSGYASKKTTVKDITDKSNLNLAEEYDSTSTYAVDDYVIYESVLYKCIATTTGAFDSTKWTSVVVTDEMGSGGGGGTGGHTIIDENGNSMTARAGLQFVGGANVSDDSANNKTIVDLASAGGIDGVFIDTSNIIVPQSAVGQSPKTYTATEDCIMWVYLVIKNNNASVSVDGNVVFYASSLLSQNTGQTGLIPLKKGQTATITVSDYSNSQYTVYGIQTGTTHSKFQPVIYSFEEREIGVWTDGKPLYEKTIDFGALPNASQKAVSHNISNVDKIWIQQSFVTDGSNFWNVNRPNTAVNYSWNGSANGTNVYVEDAVNLSTLSAIVTVQYTKTTDVAGSGTWTPQGVPAHHYSTDEHIVGTWFDETLYEKTIEVNSDGNDRWTQVFNDQTANIVSFEGYVLYANGEYGSANYFVANNAYCRSLVYDSRHKLQVYPVNSVTASSKIYMTIRYTKTS